MADDHRGPSEGHVLTERARLYYRSVGEGRPIIVLHGVRRHFGFDSVAVLGHSWGGVLAMEYATRHPDRVSHLILANTAPRIVSCFDSTS
jgi:pimeloyl-ACP methyl ester carboxylesterase